MYKPKDADEYIKSFPEDVGKLLEQIRKTVKETAPQATEVISYGMPAYKMNRILVYFAAHTNHVGFYPGPSAIAAFKKDLQGYKGAKGSVQFPFNEAMPLNVIAKMVAFRITEDKERAERKRKK